MKVFYLFFLAAIFIDLVVLPLSGAFPWLPRFTLALLPFAFLVTPVTVVGVVFLLTTLLFWLTAGINLGIVVFALGITLFFERWLLPKFFHPDVWQTLIISSSGVLIFGLVLALTNKLLRLDFFFGTAFIVSLVLSTILAIPITILFKKYEKALV